MKVWRKIKFGIYYVKHHSREKGAVLKQKSKHYVIIDLNTQDLMVLEMSYGPMVQYRIQYSQCPRHNISFSNATSMKSHISEIMFE